MSVPTFEDWLAIANLKAAYCRLLDSKDWQGWGEVWAEDAVQDVTGSGGETFHGRAAIVAATRGSIETAKTAHQVHFPEISIDGETATAIWPMQDRVVWNEGRALTGYGHYHERYAKCEGRWQIAELKLTRLQMDFD
jgi:hypothetical protein